jgi:redox-sensitive bicupin YhaK (pirin superfamily)
MLRRLIGKRNGEGEGTMEQTAKVWLNLPRSQSMNQPKFLELPSTEDTDLVDQVVILRSLIMEIQVSYQKRTRAAFEAGYEAALNKESPLEAYFKFTNGTN